MVQINWTIQSKEDLQSIAEYISRDSKTYAKRHVKRIKNRVQILRKLPQSGVIVHEFNDTSIRELIFGNYRIIYKIVNPKRLDIITVHHSARDLSKRKLL